MPGSQSGRDAQTARDLHFRSLWHSPLRPHRRKAPETAAEPLLRDQNRSRRHSSELPQCFRTQRLDRASIQHLRAATERESHNSLHHFPDCSRNKEHKGGRPVADARFQLCGRHMPRIYRNRQMPRGSRTGNQHRHGKGGQHADHP